MHKRFFDETTEDIRHQDILRFYRTIWGEEATETQRRQNLNGNKSKQLVPKRFEELFQVLRRIIEDGKQKPIKVIMLLLDPTDPKDLPAIEEQFLSFKAKYSSNKKKAKKVSIEDVEKFAKAQKEGKKKGPAPELKWPSEWILEFVRRSRVPSNWRVKSSS